MNVVTSHLTRVLVVRLSKGESLVESLATLARDHSLGAATVLGHGLLQTLTVEGYDPRARAYNDRRSFSGSLGLTALTGHVLFGSGEPVVNLHATVSRETDNGLEVIGGHLLDAQVIAVDVTLFAHDDLRLVVQVDPATGLASWRGESRDGNAPAKAAPSTSVPAMSRPVAAPASAPPPPREAPREAPRDAPQVMLSSRSLADVARALEAMPVKVEREAEVGGEGDIQPGDFIDHPAWRLCEVLREPEAGTFDIRIMERGTTRTIKTEIFEVQPRPPRDGKRVWALKPRGK